MAKKNPSIGLRLLERLTLLNLLQGVSGGFVTLALLESLNRRLSLTRAEIRRLKVQERPDGSAQWDARADQPRTFRFEPLEHGLVVKRLRALADQEQLTLMHKPLVEKFIGDSAFEEAAAE